MTEVLFSPYH